MTAVRTKGEGIDAFDSLERERAVKVRKQGPTARGLPFEDAAQRAGVDADQQQIALACKMFCGGLGDLGRGREMNKIVATIDLGAAKHTGVFSLSP